MLTLCKIICLNHGKSQSQGRPGSNNWESATSNKKTALSLCCSRQGIALRGHKDDFNKGKFRALIDFWTDVILKDFLEKKSARMKPILLKTSSLTLLVKIITILWAGSWWGNWHQWLGTTWTSSSLCKDQWAVERVVNYITCENVGGADICKYKKKTKKNTCLMMLWNWSSVLWSSRLWWSWQHVRSSEWL